MSAPSFSSFPSFNSFPDLDPGPSKPSSKKPEESKRSDKDRKKGEKDKKKNDKKGERHKKHDLSSVDEEPRHKKGRRRRDEDDQRKHDKFLESRIEPRDIESTTRTLYYSDRRGDQLNLTYGGLHAGDVPRYNLVCRGRHILGLPALTVVHRGRHDISVAVGGKRKLPSLTDPSSRHLLNAPPSRRLLSSSEDKYKYQEVEGFLRISSGKQRSGDPSYRSITNHDKDAISDESDTSDDDDSRSVNDSESDTTPITSLQATLKELEIQLTAEPSSIPTWLSLLSHTLSTIPLLSKNAVKARAEISLSILSRAISAHPDNANSKKLRIKYLKAGEDIWHESKLRSEWQDALKIGGIEIWMEWLDWKLRNAQNGAEGIVENVKRVYAALGATQESEVARLRVFWRAGVAIREAGYVERAMALFQAQGELAYNAPSTLSTASFGEQLDQLEEFWESEVPRVGEADASGWATWYTSSRSQWEKPSPLVAPPKRSSSGDPYTRWAEDELSVDCTHQLPTRTIDDLEEDPYSTILFSDIRPLLLQLQTLRAKQVFRLIWLSFLGLYIPGLSASLSPVPSDCADDRWSCGHLSSPRSLSAIFPLKTSSRITADSQAGVLIGRERDYSSVFGPVKNWSYGVFDSMDSVGSGHWRMWSSAELENVKQDLVREIFRQCRITDESEDWSILMIAFESAISTKNASKVSKALLAKDQTSLSLWANHARIERLRGRLEEARKLYRTVLTSTPPDRAGQGALWWDWAEVEWLSGQSEAAIQVVVRSVQAQGTGGMALLRAKRNLEDVLAKTPLSHWKERESWLKLRGLLELLTSTPAAALALLDAHSSSLETGTPSHEGLTVASLGLLYNHGTTLKNPMPPALLRERAQKAIEIYPNNTFILGVFLEGEKGQGVWGRLRALLRSGDGAGAAAKDVPRRVAEVWVASWDKSRWEAEEERTRNGLSAAVEDERCRGSSVLWRVYLEFEIRCGRLERAKKLLFRAVSECPLVKELYLLAFGPLRSVFTARELNDWGENMVEKGIRMRRGLDEALEGWIDPHQRRMESQDDDVEDEIEHNARELRRLRPY